jgi:hypothetical protein
MEIAPRRATAALALAAFGLLLFAARSWVIATYGNATPYWDQWDGEAHVVYALWREGALAWEHLVMPHNEHRVLFSKLLALLLLEANGQWNPLLQMLVNALLHVAAIAATAWLACRALGRECFAAAIVAALPLFAVPYAWENILGGFQSQFYLLLLASSASLWLGAGVPAFAPRWWSAVAMAVVSYFCMASGAITFLALCAMALLAFFRGAPRGQARELAAAAILVAAFLACHHAIPLVEHHLALRASEALAFHDAVQSVLAWPLKGSWIRALVRNLPALLLLAVVVRAPQATRLQLFLLGLFAWCVGQSLAIAYGRVGEPFNSRYLDLYAWTIWCNVLCALALFATASRRRLAAIACVAWMALVVGAVVMQARPAAGEMALKREQGRRQEASVAAYVQSGDLAHLQSGEIPYPQAGKLAAFLDRPATRALLPSNIAPPLVPLFTSEPEDAFRPGGWWSGVAAPNAPGWGSFTEAGNSSMGVARIAFDAPRTRHVELLVAGYPRREGMKIEVEQGGKRRELRLPRDPREAWETLRLRVRPGRFDLVLTDATPVKWMAIAAVRPAGRLDGATRWLLDHPEAPALLAAFLVLANLLARAARREPDPPLSSYRP